MNYYRLTYLISKKENKDDLCIINYVFQPGVDGAYFAYHREIMNWNENCLILYDRDMKSEDVPDVIFDTNSYMFIVNEKCKKFIESRVSSDEILFFPVLTKCEKNQNRLEGQWYISQITKWIECVIHDRKCVEGGGYKKLLGYNDMDGPPLQIKMIPSEVDIFRSQIIGKPEPNRIYQEVFFSERLKRALKENGIRGFEYFKAKIVK